MGWIALPLMCWRVPTGKSYLVLYLMHILQDSTLWEPSAVAIGRQSASELPTPQPPILLILSQNTCNCFKRCDCSLDSDILSPSERELKSVVRYLVLKSSVSWEIVQSGINSNAAFTALYTNLHARHMVACKESDCDKLYFTEVFICWRLCEEGYLT